MKRLFAMFTASATAVFALAAAPALASVPSNPSAAVAAPVLAPPAWWAAFNDESLNSLLARGSATPAAQLALVRSYIEFRTAQARGLLAERLQSAAQQQREAATQTLQAGDERSRWENAATARAAQWAELQQFMAAEQARSEGTLAALTGIEPEVLRQQLAAGAGQMPTVDAAPPTAPDTEASAPVQALQQALTQALQARQLVNASELELQARQLRQQAGAGSVLDVTEAYQHLLADADRMAALAGGLADHWALLLQGDGGATTAALAAQAGAGNRVTGTGRAPRGR